MSIAQQVSTYLDGKPAIKECLALDIVNLSALARKVGQDLGIPGHDAVLAACRRYRATPKTIWREQAVRRVLRRSRLETRTRIATVTVRSSYDNLLRLEKVVNELLSANRLIRLIPTSQGNVLIVEDDTVSAVTRAISSGNIVKVRKGLVELSVTSPESIEEVPGVMAFLSSSLASEGLNVLQVLSCYMDTILVMEEKDLMEAFRVLKRAME
jgi:hypothetical protein